MMRNIEDFLCHLLDEMKQIYKQMKNYAEYPIRLERIDKRREMKVYKLWSYYTATMKSINEKRKHTH